VRLDPALDALLMAPPEQRGPLLNELAGDDAGFRAELESLLRAHDAAGEFLETPAPISAAMLLRDVDERLLEESAGELVGPYRLLEEIGRGGMGTVWLAERADGQFDQLVALKLVKRGMDTDEIVARFRRERQILARLHHPNIARLLDGGVSADGRPYFVMEHVAGGPITTYCADHRLTTNQRLALFETVCAAVQHAHRSLIVHRDLKPSNVLVTADGTVKLLDFGIAKLIGEDAELQTVAGWSRPFTPEYASPELVSGAAITTASDVYQLGILLYELLTGARPYRFAPLDVTGMRRVICEVEPDRPSLRNHELRGDLEAILLTALRKEPEQRYLTADALAADLRRNRFGLPVAARGAGNAYRVAKFVRRNRGRLLTSAAFLAVALTFAAAYTLRLRGERDRAVLEAAKAGQSAEFFRLFFEGWNPDAADSGQVRASDLLDDATRRIEREYRAQPDIRSAMLSLLGGLYTGIGRYEAADTLLERALEVQRRLHPGDNADLAATMARRGRLLTARGEHREAEAHLRTALRMNRSLFGPRHPESLRAQRDLAAVISSDDRPAEAELLLREILALTNGPDDDSPFLADVSSKLAYTLFQQARYPEALSIYEPALSTQKRVLGEVHAVTLATMRGLASTLRDLGRLAPAESLYRDAVRVARTLYGDEHFQTGIAEYVLALHLHRSGGLAEAERLARKGIATRERAFVAGYPLSVAWQSLLGVLRLDQGDVATAAPLLRTALERIRQSSPGGHQEEADVLNRLSFITTREGTADADAVYRAALAVRDRRPPNAPDFVTDGIHFLAWSMLRRGDLDRAEDVYRRSVNLYERLLPPEHPYLTAARSGLTEVSAEKARGAGLSGPARTATARPRAP
jgi:serine/threonine-protein kinase